MTYKWPILVTGGAGYIGSHVVMALLDAGWPVIVVDNLSTGFRWAVDKRAIFFEGDIGNRGLVDSILKKHEVKAIMHFAGSIVVPESVSNPVKYYINNIGKTALLLESATQMGVRHFIFSSSAAVYGVPGSVPIEEDAPTKPISPYGQSKLMAEQMLADVALAHALNYCALRYFNVAGADPLGRSGQSTAEATHLIKIAVECASGRRDSISVFGKDFETHDGTGIRDYVHVADLANAHVHALELLVEEPERSHILNCGYGRGYSVLEVLSAVQKFMRHPLNIRFAERRAGDPPSLVAGNSRILQRTRWQPEYDSLEEIVRHALAWENRHLFLPAANEQPHRVFA